jgi:lipopolysaccharide/colanic/teichoic acid biosynthesis glycosyltransferase
LTRFFNNLVEGFSNETDRHSSMSPQRMEITLVCAGAERNGGNQPAACFSRWTLSRSKRLFDLLMSAPLLALTAPVMALTALAVRASSPGPLLFRQARIGKDGVDFQILKFRTMTHAPNGNGPRLTQREDPRITPIGRLIRRSRLDELPQLWNVIRGDMSLVGPRPDVREFLACLKPREASILKVRPGITSLTSLEFRHEDDLLPQGEREMTQHYVEKILPEKVRLELDYAEKATLLSDLKVLFRTAASVFRP